jgi:type IV secretory pathway VirB10-like protein
VREPTVRRPRRLSRQQRLLRTAIGVVGVVAIAALIANALGGGKNGPKAGQQPVATVAFDKTVKVDTDSPKTPRQSQANAEADAIVRMLNDWYQRGFVDPKLYGDGTFPQIASHFTKDAQASFAKDVSSLTIGDARTLVDRVDPTNEKTTITIYFNGGSTPTFAVAAIRFAATAIQKDLAQPRIDIVQSATLHLVKDGGKWLVDYYSAKSSEQPVVPSPSASPSGSTS